MLLLGETNSLEGQTALEFSPGRPNFDQLFQNMKKQILLGHIWTMVCGPSSMNEDIQWMCFKHSNERLQFVFKDHTFLF